MLFRQCSDKCDCVLLYNRFANFAIILSGSSYKKWNCRSNLLPIPMELGEPHAKVEQGQKRKQGPGKIPACNLQVGRLHHEPLACAG